MKRMANFIGMTTVVLSLFACNCSKKTVTQASGTTSASTQKANLLDGTWEVNYILPQEKSFADLFPGQKPTITFNTVSGTISGFAGCNQFNGTFTTSEYNISIPAELALTKKMCPVMTGEQAFLETLKKVNTYSVTEQGKTLNMMMGDVAILRASRK